MSAPEPRVPLDLDAIERKLSALEARIRVANDHHAPLTGGELCDVLADWRTKGPALVTEVRGLGAAVEMYDRNLHNVLVAMQAAWIEWRRGGGAEAGMLWIENTLDGPGLLVDPSAPHGRDAQAYFNANRVEHPLAPRDAARATTPEPEGAR